MAAGPQQEVVMKKNLFSSQTLIIALVIMTGISVSLGQVRISNSEVQSINLDAPLITQPQIFVDADKLGNVSLKGIGFSSGESVTLTVEALNVFMDQPVLIGQWKVMGDIDGVFTSSWFMANRAGRYRATANGGSSGVVATVDFDGTAILAGIGNLDQCANGAVGGVPIVCSGKAWQNGNLNHNQAHYNEGESVAYRIIFSDMVIGSTNTVTIEWDTTESAKHAIDYVTSYNQSETDADPCSGIAGCVLSNFSDWPIPVDPRVTAGQDGIFGNADDIVQIPGVFTFYDAQILGVSPYTITGDYAGASQTSITITFRATSATPVLAWGGHISTRDDWGIDHSAIAISGSPFHMRLLDIDGSGGNQDRSLTSSAAVFPAEVTIIKRVYNLDLTYASTFQFGFTSSANFGITNFSLVDNDPLELAGASISNDQLIHFGAINTITVTEDLIPTGKYTLSDLTCTEIGGGVDPVLNTTWSFITRTATIIPDEGEFITCTFTNTELVPTAAEVPVGGRIVVKTEEGMVGIGSSVVTLTPVAAGERYMAVSNSFGYFQFDSVPVGETYILTVAAKGYSFDPPSMTISVFDPIQDLQFIANRLE